jgi:hypothetical protein
MKILDQFARRQDKDFVVICISQDTRENVHISSRFGFYHLLERSNSVTVLRDLGYRVGLLFGKPPKMFVVDGTTGYLVSPHGALSVVARPDTCFKSWAAGYTGVEPIDFIKGRFF